MKPFLISFLCFIPIWGIATNPQGIIDGNNKFAFNLYHQVQGGTTGSNLFFSPFSISTAVAMVYAGARTETALQISQTLNFQQGEKFHIDYSQLLKELVEGAENKIKLNIANGLWAQKDYKFLDSYFDFVKSNYRSELKNVDFTDNTERENTRKEINVWVEQKTNDKIKDLLSQGDLNSMTRLVLVNAIYFYGNWEEPFNKQRTEPKDFTLLNGNKINIPFMTQRSNYKYYEDAKIQAIEIPYKDNKASMVIFLPKKNKWITEFENSFDYKYYQDIINALQSHEVRLSVPKFQTTCKISLGTILSQMGMPLAFSSNADFSGMTGKKDLFISEVIHQAFIDVDEKGTEAAAATAVVMKMTSIRMPDEPKIFNADHPFVFLIKDNTTGSILFMGKIMNPDLSK